MILRKMIFIGLLLGLVMAQFSVAQHHLSHHEQPTSLATISGNLCESAGHSHPDQDHHQKHECPECTLVQLLQTAFYNASAFLTIETIDAKHTSFSQNRLIALNSGKSNLARAPPATLI